MKYLLVLGEGINGFLPFAFIMFPHSMYVTGNWVQLSDVTDTCSSVQTCMFLRNSKD